MAREYGYQITLCSCDAPVKGTSKTEFAVVDGNDPAIEILGNTDRPIRRDIVHQDDFQWAVSLK